MNSPNEFSKINFLFVTLFYCLYDISQSELGILNFEFWIVLGYACDFELYNFELVACGNFEFIQFRNWQYIIEIRLNTRVRIAFVRLFVNLLCIWYNVAVFYLKTFGRKHRVMYVVYIPMILLLLGKSCCLVIEENRSRSYAFPFL